MRKIVISLSLILILALAAAAQEEEKPKPAFGVFIDTFPIINWSYDPARTDNINDMKLSDRAFSEFYNRPSLLTLGLCFEWGERAKGAVTIELQQDIWSRVWKNSWWNIPDSYDTWYPTAFGLGTFFPNLGYVEYTGEYFHGSFGRRKIKAGPGSIGLGISSANPYYDHIALGASAPLGPGRLYYDYVLVIMQRWGWNPETEMPKLFLFHRTAWMNDYVTVGFTDYNIVADTAPDFQDLSPFSFYHQLYNTNHNVMLGSDFEYRPIPGIVSIYGEFLIDDIQGEGEGSNPTAIGLALGAEWKILDADPPSRPLFNESDHVYSIERPRAAGGLSMRLEHYLASTYMYRRLDKDSNGVSLENQTITARYNIMTNWPGHWGERITPFMSAPLQPDTFLTRLAFDWEGLGFAASCIVDFRLKGSQCEKLSFGEDDRKAGVPWFWPSAPNVFEFSLSLNGLYRIDKRSIATASIYTAIQEGGRAEFAFSVGYGIRLGFGATPRQ